jgi:multicomponent Na+:H+ antiporter subunit F
VSTFLVATLLVVAVLIAIGLYRVWAGPTVFDRLVAIAQVSVNGVVVLAVLGFVLERPSLFLDIALGYALLAFLLPIALGRYFEERDDGTSQDGSAPRGRRGTPLGVVPHGWVAERGRLETQRRAEMGGLIGPLEIEGQRRPRRDHGGARPDGPDAPPPAEGSGPSSPVDGPGGDTPPDTDRRTGGRRDEDGPNDADHWRPR